MCKACQDNGVIEKTGELCPCGIAGQVALGNLDFDPEDLTDDEIDQELGYERDEDFDYPYDDDSTNPDDWLDDGLAEISLMKMLEGGL